MPFTRWPPALQPSPEEPVILPEPAPQKLGLLAAPSETALLADARSSTIWYSLMERSYQEAVQKLGSVVGTDLHDDPAMVNEIIPCIVDLSEAQHEEGGAVGPPRPEEDGHDIRRPGGPPHQVRASLEALRLGLGEAAAHRLARIVASLRVLDIPHTGGGGDRHEEAQEEGRRDQRLGGCEAVLVYEVRLRFRLPREGHGALPQDRSRLIDHGDSEPGPSPQSRRTRPGGSRTSEASRHPNSAFIYMPGLHRMDSMDVHRQRFNLLLKVLIVAFTIGILGAVGLTAAHAMGPAPQACTNLYDSSITSAQIFTANGTSIDLFAHNGTTIDVAAGGWYEVDLGFSISPTSVAGNTGDGQIWIETDVSGFSNSFCYPEYLTSGIAGSTTMADSTIVTEPTSNFLPQGTQTVLWYTACDGTLIQSCADAPRVTYTVDWEPEAAASTSTVTSTVTTTVTTTVTSVSTETITGSTSDTSTTPVTTQTVTTTETTTISSAVEIATSSPSVTTDTAPEFPAAALAYVLAVVIGVAVLGWSRSRDLWDGA